MKTKNTIDHEAQFGEWRVCIRTLRENRDFPGLTLSLQGPNAPVSYDGFANFGLVEGQKQIDEFGGQIPWFSESGILFCGGLELLEFCRRILKVRAFS